jgi:hypothetical protein
VRVTLARAGNPAQRGRDAGGVVEARLDEADLGPLGDEPHAREEEVVVGQRRVVVEEEDVVARNGSGSRVTPGGNADVLGQGQGSGAARQIGGGPTVAHHDDVDLDVALALHRQDAAVQVIRTRALCEHDHADARKVPDSPAGGLVARHG